MRTLALFSVLVFALTVGALAGPRLQWGASSGLYLAIPDEDPAGVTYTVNVTDHFIIADLNVRVVVYHNNVHDLEILLEGPTGDVVELWSHECIFKNDLDLYLDDQSGVVECGDQDLGKTSFPDPYGKNLAYFNGTDAFGEWTFTIADTLSGTDGEAMVLMLYFLEDYNTPRIDALQTDVTTVAADVEMVKTDLGTVKDDVATANSRVIALQGSVDEVQADVDVANARLDTLQSSVDGVQASVDDVGARVDGVQSSVDQVQSDLNDLRDHVTELEVQTIEKALWNREPITMYVVPNSLGGKLNEVRTVVLDAIAVMGTLGEPTGMAATFVANGDTQLGMGNYRNAFQFYARAYCLAVSPESDVERCYS